MECGNTHFRSYVYTGFKLGKSAIQLTEELQAVFGSVWSGLCAMFKNCTVYSYGLGLLRWLIQFPEKCDFGTLLVSFTCSPARFSVTVLPKGETVTADYMVEYLKDTGNRFRNLKKDKIAFKNFLLQMDNARPHSAERTQTYLEQNGVPIVPQSLYSPDLNFCDRFLIARLQENCRAKEYGNGEELYIDAKRYLRSLPEDLLLHELNKLLEHCRAVIREAGAYVTN